MSMVQTTTKSDSREKRAKESQTTISLETRKTLQNETESAGTIVIDMCADLSCGSVTGFSALLSQSIKKHEEGETNHLRRKLQHKSL